MKTMKNIPNLLGIALVGSLLAWNTQAAITDNLAVHLTFDNNYNDSSGHGNNGFPMGNPKFQTGILGQAVAVTTKNDGSEFDYVTLNYPSQLLFANNVDFSISFWTSYTNQVDDPPFISNKNWSSSGNPGWGIFTQNGGNFRVNTTDDAGHNQGTSNTPVIRDGKWHLVTVTFQRTGNATIYVDGVQATTYAMTAMTGSVDTINSGLNINIGQDGTGAYNDGGSAQMVNVLIDDVGIWTRALSGAEVLAIYNAGKAGKSLDHVPSIQDPYVTSMTPGWNATGVRPDATVSVVIADGVNKLATNSVVMTINGSPVTVTQSKTGAETTITYTPTTLLPSGLTTATIIYGNDAMPQTLFTNTWSFSSTYVMLTPGYKVTPVTSKPGFLWHIFANQANQVNSNDRAELALAGLLPDGTGGYLPNLADQYAQGDAMATAPAPSSATAPLNFEISTVINESAAGGSTFGDFTPDGQMPGVPATDGSTAGLAVEIITYINLPAGVTVMGVNSDDGFRTTTGIPWDVTKSLVAGEYSGGRGSADTIFTVVAQEAGVYPFRTVYENGGGDADVEWFTVKSDGTKVLVNDTVNGGLTAYRATTTPIDPYIKSITPPPVPRQTPTTSPSLVVALSDGDTAVDDNSVSLKVDGSVVNASKSRSGKLVTLTYSPAGMQIPTDQHTAELVFRNTSGSLVRTQQWTFLNLKNVVLPNPVATENFDSYAEGTVPTGWTAWNFTDTDAPGEDLDNLHSDTYKGWIVVSRDRLAGLKSRIFNVAPNQTINGQPVTVDTLSTGNLMYAESDVRSGNQVQFIISKPFDLSMLTNAVIAFGSLYEQNQDSCGALEYSIDGGTNWLPVVYYLDYVDAGGDIRLNADGTVDAVTTFNEPNPDTATWTDNGVAKGGKYGDAIAAPITQALGIYIAPRANDDPVTDKRLELYRLPTAGGHSDVRLRFAQIGTGSWYWGVDNIAFYEGPAPITPPTPGSLSIALQSGNAVITWTGSGVLQSASSVTGPWSNVSNATSPYTVTPAVGAAFYRLSQ
jgi:hypothetical protein